jgi:pyrroline-5-carboxylate reductase
LLLVGCGKMGGAMLQGWLASGDVPKPIVVVEPLTAARAAFSDHGGITALLGDDAAIASDFAPEIVILATKPQGMEQVAPRYRRFAESGALTLSVAAGRTLGFFAQHLGRSAAIIRAMPNTPAQVARGITVCCANMHTDAKQRALADRLLRSVGEVGWVEDEALIDAVTAVSGSGPAYVFLLAECLAAAGARAGLPTELATRLARATVAGAGELLHRSHDDAATLRQNVTSPNGTTAAALSVLMAADGMRPLLDRAVEAAARRSRELAAS